MHLWTEKLEVIFIQSIEIMANSSPSLDSKITIRELEHKNIIRIVQGPLCKLSTGHHHKLRHLPSAIDFDFELDLDLDLDSSSCRLCRRKLLNLEMREDALIICLNWMRTLSGWMSIAAKYLPFIVHANANANEWSQTRAMSARLRLRLRLRVRLWICLQLFTS